MTTASFGGSLSASGAFTCMRELGAAAIPGHFGLSTHHLQFSSSGMLDWAVGLQGTAVGLRLAQVSGVFLGQISVTAVPSSASCYVTLPSDFPPLQHSVLSHSFPSALLSSAFAATVAPLLFLAPTLHLLIAPLPTLALTSALLHLWFFLPLLLPFLLFFFVVFPHFYYRL